MQPARGLHGTGAAERARVEPAAATGKKRSEQMHRAGLRRYGPLLVRYGEFVSLRVKNSSFQSKIWTIRTARFPSAY